MADALAADAVTSPTADGGVRGGAAVVLLGGAVVALGALALRAQPPGVAQADAALVGAVAVVALRAVRLSLSLAPALALEVHDDLQGVLEAQRLDGEGLLLLFGAAPGPRLNAE